MRETLIFRILIGLVLAGGAGGCGETHDERLLPVGTGVEGTIPSPEAAFGSMASGSTVMQSRRFRTYVALGVFSGRVIEVSNTRSTGVTIGLGTATEE